MAILSKLADIFIAELGLAPLSEGLGRVLHQPMPWTQEARVLSHRIRLSGCVC